MSSEEARIGLQTIDAAASSILAVSTFDPQQALAAINKIAFVYESLSGTTKRRADKVIDKIFDSDVLGISSEPTATEEVVEDLEFDFPRLKPLIMALDSERVAKIFVGGQNYRDQRKRGVEDEDLEREFEEREGDYGLSIIKMMKTGDIVDVLDDLDIESGSLESEFNEWVNNYSNFSLLLKPEHVRNNPEDVKEWILQRAKGTHKDYFKVHIQGPVSTIYKVPGLIEDLQAEGKLKFEDKGVEEKEIAFDRALEIRVDLP